MNTKKGHYLSESKGLLKIRDMPTPHIKNAIVKIMEIWIEDLKQKDLDNEKFIDLFANPGNNRIVLELYEEMLERETVAK